MDSSDSDTESPPSALKGWTRAKKFQLLEALKCYGSDDIENVSKSIDKTEDETLAAVTYFKKKAHKHIPPSVKSKHSTINVSQGSHSVPLANWANLATEFSSDQDLQSEKSNLASALRLVAEFENIPKPNETYNINFKEIYNLIANALDDKPLNETTNSKFILERCIIETALFTKSFIDENEIGCALNNVYKPDPSDSFLSQDIELSTIRQLSEQKFYNPFNISEEYLKQKNS